MMKGKNIRTVLLLLLALCAGVPPLRAQSDGFFGSGGGGSRDGEYVWGFGNQSFGSGLGGGIYGIDNQGFGSGSGDNYGINNQTFGQSVPLGGGLAILVASAAGYTLVKRRQDNRQKSQKH